jgi:hypothetical protein
MLVEQLAVYHPEEWMNPFSGQITSKSRGMVRVGARAMKTARVVLSCRRRLRVTSASGQSTGTAAGLGMYSAGGVRTAMARGAPGGQLPEQNLVAMPQQAADG